MAKPGQISRAHKASRLLARYCDTFGEMQLRKYTERAIRAARAEAELNHRSKSAFLSTMSHELRTPLNAIIGFSDLIRTPGATSSAEAADYAGHIANAGRRLLDVVSDVMDMSKLEAGSLVLDLQPVMLSEILEIALEDTRAAVRRQAAAGGHAAGAGTSRRRWRRQAPAPALRQSLVQRQQIHRRQGPHPGDGARAQGRQRHHRHRRHRRGHDP